MTQTSVTQRGSKQAADKSAIRPFHVNFPEAELTELRRLTQQSGLNGKRSRMHRKACNSRRCRYSHAIGGRNTTGGRWRRD